MVVRILDGKPLARGGVVEGHVGRDERHRPETSILVTLMQIEGDGQLHGIVSSEPMLAAARIA